MPSSLLSPPLFLLFHDVLVWFLLFSGVESQGGCYGVYKLQPWSVVSTSEEEFRNRSTGQIEIRGNKEKDIALIPSTEAMSIYAHHLKEVKG